MQTPVREVRELPEDDDVHERGERGHEYRPRHAEERLLVADDDVAPDESCEKLAEVPELGDVEVRETRRRANDRRAAGSDCVAGFGAGIGRRAVRARDVVPA